MREVYAQTGSYILLESIRGTTEVQTSGADSFAYFGLVYRTTLYVIVALALLMIAIGGIQYISSFASPSGKGDATKRIWGAIGGLLLALFSWLILSTINPDLLSPTFTAPEATSVAPATRSEARALNPMDPLFPGDANGDGIPDTGDPDEGADNADPGVGTRGVAGGMTEQQARDYLMGKIAVNHECNSSGCQTRLAGIKQSTLDQVFALKANCQCNPVITAGTEVGHSTTGTHTHGNGYKVDISQKGDAGVAIQRYVTTPGNFTQGPNRSDGAETWVKNGSGGKVVYYKESNHWDVSVKP